ncbi:MAG: iron ABC transporter permease [Oscillospiraceae bacterium]|jgi:iron(III) transport system permease protein|nr:iron ABC transporter permease [Oscillospiraceae bacterium]
MPRPRPARRSGGIQRDVWLGFTLAAIALYALFLIYPLVTLLSKSVVDPATGGLSLSYFTKFFSRKMYYTALLNSLLVTSGVTLLCVLLATPLAYIMATVRIRFKPALEILILISSMSAPFIGAYSWIMLFGRSGAVTVWLRDLVGITIPDIYGLPGILLVLSMQLYSLVYMYLAGAFKSMDNSLIEAAESLGCTGLAKMRRIVLPLLLPTLLAGALMVFMRAFADFGTPQLIGEGFRTVPVLVYTQFMGEVGTDDGFAAAISIVIVVVTTAAFLVQKLYATRKQFTMSALHPIQPKAARGAKNVLAHLYCYVLVGIAMLPQFYVLYTSFQKTNGKIFVPGYSLQSYADAFRQLGKSIWNTYWLALVAIAVIVVLGILISYVVVRRRSVLASSLDITSMFPQTVAGAIIGIALLVSFNHRPLLLSGTAFIMILSFVIRRLPYTVRASAATLQQMSISVEEAAISLGASTMKTFFRVTVPMMLPGVLAGAIISWIMIITELATSIILYTGNTQTMTLAIYSQITRGNYGIAAALSSILTLTTVLSLVLFFRLTGKRELTL